MSSEKSCWTFLLAVLAITVAVCANDPQFESKTARRSDRNLNNHMSHWAIKLAQGANPHEIAEKHGHELVSRVGSLDNVFLFRQRSNTVHGVTHPEHSESEEIHWADKQVPIPRSKRSYAVPPTDPLYLNQWHLHSVNTLYNVHINVESVWMQNITGNGVNIAITDDGLDFLHQDISPNYRKELSYDFNFNKEDPYPDGYSDTHGTNAAGVAAARDNSVCGVGAAPRAGLAGLRMLAADPSDYIEGSALSFHLDKIHIFSNSWGPTDDGTRKEGPGRLASLAIEKGIKEGRGGKGTIYIWAGGNGRTSSDNCNYDGYVNKRYTISIAASDYKGEQAYYSEDCAMHVISAPSSGSGFSISTTARGGNHNGCTTSFGGTSAAAPLVSGIVALMLEVNPNLTWRDVIAILINTAIKNAPHDVGWKQNGGGYHYNHKFGFGMVDSHGAVEKSKNWHHLSPEISATAFANSSGSIPMLAYTNLDTPWLISEISVENDFIVEHVALRFIATHPRRGDLRILLHSPAGTVSILAEKHKDSYSNYDWTFGSIVNWGERTKGTWKLTVRDEGFQDVQASRGILNSWELTLYGRSL